VELAGFGFGSEVTALGLPAVHAASKNAIEIPGRWA
jgi:hypothetical protein